MAAVQSQPIAFASSSRRRGDSISQSFAQSPNGFAGSPMSFKLQRGSFSATHFYPGYSPGASSGLFDLEYVRKLSSSLESRHGHILRAKGVGSPPQSEMGTNYSCCGLTLTDLHALVEHYEEVHVVVLGEKQSDTKPPNPSAPTSQSQSSSSSSIQDGAFDPDDMEMEVDSAPSTGPTTPANDIPSPFETIAVSHPGRLSTTFATTRMNAQPYPRSTQALNPYAGYAGYSSLMPGTVAPPASPADGAPLGVPPSLLFSGSASTTPDHTPSPSRVSSPGPSSDGHRDNAPRPSTTLSRPASSLLLSKPFRCPKEGCNKSYKQANGLKYHLTHGQCTYGPRDPATEGLSEHELEEKIRPFQCQVAPCMRRYKNMNGLRYHYQHSGDHGAIGLALLLAGEHQGATEYRPSKADTNPRSSA